jgi:hypothetical protein
MNAYALDKRLRALEKSVPVIYDLADFVLWMAHGRNPNVKWDPIFRKQLEDAFSRGKHPSGKEKSWGCVASRDVPGSVAESFRNPEKLSDIKDSITDLEKMT